MQPGMFLSQPPIATSPSMPSQPTTVAPKPAPQQAPKPAPKSAEQIAREHARLALKNLEYVMTHDRSLIDRVPGLALVTA